MGIYYCNHCKHIAELPVSVQVTQTSCQNCQQTVKAYDTPFFVRNILERWAATRRELQSFQQQDDEENGQNINAQDTDNNLDDVKFSDTDVLATEQQHQPLKSWFERQHIMPKFDYDTVNMRGFFDEASLLIGDNYDVFQDLLGRINWSYRKAHIGLNYDLNKLSQKDGQFINKTCRAFYSHTLFSRYDYYKQGKIVKLKLQKAPQIQKFFGGEWLEWFALSTILSHIETIDKFPAFSIARSVNIQFQNEDLHELDVVFFSKGKQPIIIECKSGEFRNEIDKYLRLQKRLKLPASNFVILATNLDESQASALNGMYNLTFLTLKGFKDFIRQQLE